MELKLFSFFSGLGLLDLGFEKNNYEILEVFESYEPFLAAYEYSRKEMGIVKPRYGFTKKNVSDLLNDNDFENKVRNEKKKGLIGFIGGPPCPDFSIAGKNKGNEGMNGRLSTDYFDLIKINHPDFFLFENVKGIWSTKKHREYIQNKIDEKQNEGYYVSYGVLNSLEYGVAQSRERFFILGIDEKLAKRLGLNTKINFFENTSLKSIDSILQYDWPKKDKFQENSVLLLENNILKELTIEYWFEKNNVDNHYNSKDYFKPRSLEKFYSIEEGDVSRKSFKRLHRNRYSPTAAYGNNEVHLHPYLARRISVSEALAIQSAPKEFKVKKELTLTDKFKCVGNAVPYLMSYNIAFKLKKILGGRS